jgi:FtsZ-binding cell division protein ZapB
VSDEVTKVDERSKVESMLPGEDDPDRRWAVEMVRELTGLRQDVRELTKIASGCFTELQTQAKLFAEVREDVEAHDDWIDDLGQARHNAIDAFIVLQRELNELKESITAIDSKSRDALDLTPTLNKRRRRKRRSDTQPSPPPDGATE